MPRLLLEVESVLACQRCQRFSATDGGKERLRETNCRGRFGTWFDEVHSSHAAATTGEYTFCVRCGAVGRKDGRNLGVQCSGAPPKVGAPHTRLKRLLEDRRTETGQKFPQEEDWEPLPPT